MSREPIPVMVRRYRCPCCTRSRSSKQAMVAHIGRCWRNPENRTCKTCANFVEASDCGVTDCTCGDTPAYCGVSVDIPKEAGLVVGCDEWEAVW